MCVPVIKLLLQQHPELSITIVSDKNLAPFFANIENCVFIGADLKGEHKGLEVCIACLHQYPANKKLTPSPICIV